MVATPKSSPVARPHGLEMLRTVVGYYQNPLQTLAGVAAKYGPVVEFRLAGYAVYQIDHPDHIKHVLQDNNRNYKISGSFDETKPVVGRGLATNNGDEWLWARRLMQPLFNRGKVADYAPALVASTQSMLDRLAGRTAAPLAIYPELLNLNHHILGRLVFGIDLSDAHLPILKALNLVREYTNRRISALVTLPTKWPTPRNRDFWAAVQLLDTFVYARIRETRATGGDGQSVLALLLQVRDEKTGEGMTDQQVRDELMTLFFAAYEDPANALTWALWLLARHPEVEGQLRQEVETTLAGRLPTYDDALTYTNAIVEETLRLYPPTWSLLRDAIGEDHLGSHAIVPGSSVLVNIYLAHRHPDFWDDPEQFKPERFLPEQSAGRPRFAYLPFGGGPRQCIAAALAMMEMKLILAMLVQRFRVEWVSPTQVLPSASHSLRPDVRSQIRLKPV